MVPCRNRETRRSTTTGMLRVMATVLAEHYCLLPSGLPLRDAQAGQVCRATRTRLGTCPHGGGFVQVVKRQLRHVRILKYVPSITCLWLKPDAAVSPIRVIEVFRVRRPDGLNIGRFRGLSVVGCSVSVVVVWSRGLSANVELRFGKCDLVTDLRLMCVCLWLGSMSVPCSSGLNASVTLSLSDE